MKMSLTLHGIKINIGISVATNYYNSINNNELYCGYFINQDFVAEGTNQHYDTTVTNPLSYHIYPKLKFTFNDNTYKEVTTNEYGLTAVFDACYNNQPYGGFSYYSTSDSFPIGSSLPINKIVTKVELGVMVDVNNGAASYISGAVYNTYTQDSLIIDTNSITINNASYSSEILLSSNSNIELDGWQKYSSITGLTPDTNYYLVVVTADGIEFIIPFTTLPPEGNIYFKINGEYKLGDLYALDKSTNTYKLGTLYRKTNSGYILV